VSVPATSQIPLDLAGPRPQNISAEERLSIGLLSLTVRTHFPAWSVEPTQSCCHVEWAETDATAARRTKEVFILDVWLCKKRMNRVSVGYRLKCARTCAVFIQSAKVDAQNIASRLHKGTGPLFHSIVISNLHVCMTLTILLT
jgi:hypothetical protein